MSGGSPEHSRLSARVIAALSSQLPEDCSVFDAKVDIWIESAEFYGQADVSVVCGALHTHTVKRKAKILGEAITNPVVIVDVLSPSTEARDRGEKFEAYKHIASLKEYVLISQDVCRVEFRRRGPLGWGVEVAEGNASVTIHGKEIAVAALYG